MTDNLPNVPNPATIESIIPEVQQAPETQPTISANSTSSIVPPTAQPLQQTTSLEEDKGGIVDQRTGHEDLDPVSTIADALTQKADKEEAEFIQGVEDEHNADKPKKLAN